jgi:hypothetical protein
MGFADVMAEIKVLIFPYLKACTCRTAKSHVIDVHSHCTSNIQYMWDFLNQRWMCSVWVIHATVVRAVWNEGVESRFRENDGKGNRFCDKDGLEEGFFLSERV